MSSSNDEFYKQLLETFRVEAAEHIKVLNDGLILLEKNFPQESTPEKLEEIYREAHSLKGAARAVDLELIQNICQAFENVLSKLRSKEISPTKELFQTSFNVLDYISSLLQEPTAELEGTEQYTDFINQLNALSGEGMPPELSAPEETPPPVEEKQEEKTPPPEQKVEQPSKQEEKTPPPPEQKVEQPPPPAQKKAKPEAKRELDDKTLMRVPIKKLDSLIVQIEELLSIKLMYQHMQKKIATAQETLQHTEKLEKKIVNGQQFVRHRIPSTADYYAQTNDIFSDIALTIQQTLQYFHFALDQLQADTIKDNHHLDGVISSLLNDTKKLLMQPFSTVLEAYPRMVRDIAGQIGKEINLLIEGGDVEIDRRILQEIKDPLTHMIRNCADHGIESPDDREKAGKPRCGTIKIAISQVGSNNVEVDICDDGRGFPFDKIKAKALSEGIITAETAEKIEEEELVKIAFGSGFSSAEIITEISGRGLGLGIISEKIEKMGGCVSVDTKTNEGTKVHVTLPLTVATFRGIQIKANDREFIIPTQSIQRILQKNAFELSTMENRPVIILDEKNYVYSQLADLLKLPSQGTSGHCDALIISSGPHTLALGVDQIVCEQEVFVKGLGKQLPHVTNISAATIAEGGKVIPILDVPDLIKSALSSPITTKSATSEEHVLQKKKVLVTEDTMTTRLLFKNILENAGYEVLTAADGAEALEILKNTPVDLLVTDIEMPNMNGFELIENKNAIDSLTDLPVIIITARENTEDKKRGIDLGATAYIEKSGFMQNDLIDIAKRVI